MRPRTNGSRGPSPTLPAGDQLLWSQCSKVIIHHAGGLSRACWDCVKESARLCGMAYDGRCWRAIAAVTSLAAQLPARTGVPRLWTDEALAGWALPVAGVNAAPKYYTEAEYYAAPVDEVRTYRSTSRAANRRVSRLDAEAGPAAAHRTGEADIGSRLARRRPRGLRRSSSRGVPYGGSPRVPVGRRSGPDGREGVTVAADGTIPGVRWLIDHDRQLKITLAECSACHTRVLPDGSMVRGAQRNLQWGSLPGFSFDALDEIRRREGRTRPPNEVAYFSYGVPWLKDDINPTLKTMTAEQVGHVDGEPYLGTFVRFNASPWFTTGSRI